MPKRQDVKTSKEVKEAKTSSFVLLEKDALIIHKPTQFQRNIEMPNIQSCICLILWHHEKAAFIHANGNGNEIASYEYLIDKFAGISPTEIKAFVIGGYFDAKRSYFLSEMMTYGTSLKSNHIGHPLLSTLKKAGIDVDFIFKHTQEYGNAKVIFNVAKGTIEKIFVVNDELAFLPALKEELARRGETARSAHARTRDKNQPYSLFTSRDNNEIVQSGFCPKDSCQQFVTWCFPTVPVLSDDLDTDKIRARVLR